MNPTVSKLVFYSMGIVAVNKPLKSREIEVSPSEDLFLIDGEITDHKEKWKTKSYDADDKPYQEEMETVVTLRATWLPCGSNRATPPDVRRGEVVAIYRFADEDKYYWTSLLYDTRLRKLETVLFLISGTRVEKDDATPENTYFVEWSTHNKSVHLHTSKADGEPFAYDFQINTKDGSFTFKDDIGNIIQVDSKNARIQLKNSDGSHVDMDRKNITITAPDNIKMVAGKNISLQAGANIETSAQKTSNNVPQTSFSGKMSVAGNVTVKQLTSAEPIVAPNV